VDDQKQKVAQMTCRSLALSAFLSVVVAGVASAQSSATHGQMTAAEAFRMSQEYAAAGSPKPALEAVETALTLQPDVPEYLKARATLSTWLGDYRRAQDSYRRLATVDPSDAETSLLYARVSAWAGDTNAAVTAYRRYLNVRPEAADAWVELARTESWRGNYAAALKALDVYRKRFGVTDAYSTELSAVMTSAGRPGKAEDVLMPLLQSAPDSYELSLTHTIALAMQQRPREAFASLDVLRHLAPGRPETRNAERVLRTLLASTAEAPVTVYSDSDRLQTERFAPRASFLLRTGTRFSAGYDRTMLDARRGSGLDQRNGRTSARYEQASVSVAQKLGALTFGGEGGYATADAHQLTAYAVSADARATDSLQFSVQRSFGYFVVSPRTVGLQLTQTGEHAQIDWSPTLRTHIAFDGSYQEISDGNRRWALVLSPRRSVARTAKVNLDLGVSAYRLQTDRDLDNGYYDPKRYESYAAVAYPYFKFSDNIGLGMTASVGGQRDETFSAFRPGGSVTAEATFGVYQPWVLKVISSATINRRLETGAFQGFGGSVVLFRRF
jgi:Tfp pilus assembly protein PilF